MLSHSNSVVKEYFTTAASHARYSVVVVYQVTANIHSISATAIPSRAGLGFVCRLVLSQDFFSVFAQASYRPILLCPDSRVIQRVQISRDCLVDWIFHLFTLSLNNSFTQYIKRMPGVEPGIKPFTLLHWPISTNYKAYQNVSSPC